MSRQKWSEKVSRATGVPYQDVRDILMHLSLHIAEELAATGTCKTELGRFHIHKLQRKVWVHPTTKKRITDMNRDIVRFKPSKTLKKLYEAQNKTTATSSENPKASQ